LDENNSKQYERLLLESAIHNLNIAERDLVSLNELLGKEKYNKDIEDIRELKSMAISKLNELL